MVTAEEIGTVEVFAALDSHAREQLSRVAADIGLEEGNTRRTRVTTGHSTGYARAASKCRIT
jgi:hypothetical protein